MTKRYFKIELNGYGGEFIQGKVTPEFVEYWKDKEGEDLAEHLTGISWDDEDLTDAHSPEVTADGNVDVWDCDDYEHINACYADNGYYLQEVTLKSADAWNEDFQCVDDPYENELEVGEGVSYDDFEHWAGGREAFTCDAEADGEIVPVLQYLSEAKGNFGIAYVVTDGEDFDPTKIAISAIETDFGEFLEAIYYGTQLLELNYDYADTTGKSTTAEVGFVNEAWRADADEFDQEVNETLADIFDEID